MGANQQSLCVGAEIHISMKGEVTWRMVLVSTSVAVCLSVRDARQEDANQLMKAREAERVRVVLLCQTALLCLLPLKGWRL